MNFEERSRFDVQAEAIARSVHVLYEKYAPEFGWNTHRESRGSWEEVPPENKALMIAVVKKLMIDDIIQPGEKLNRSM
jgi:hypothetical protein